MMHLLYLILSLMGWYSVPVPQPPVFLFSEPLQETKRTDKRFIKAKLELIVEKLGEDYSVDEVLKLQVKVRNAGTEPVTIPLSLVPRGSFFVQIFDENRRKIDFPNSSVVAYYSLVHISSVELEPAEFWGSERLTNAYHIVLSKPGTYYVQVNGNLFKDRFLRRTPVWEGHLRSKPLKITVLPKPTRSP
jgi:hypothetical protein